MANAERSEGAEGSLSTNEGSAARHAALVCFLGSITILISSGLIAFNKHLIHKDRFPFAVPLVMLHMGFCSVLSFTLFLVCPSLFPALTNSDLKKRVPIDRSLIFKGLLPISLFFAVQLVLSNTAYLYSSVAFLQMMKEAHLVFVFLFSCLVGLEVITLRCGCIIVWILFATALTVHGEINFSWTGFTIQGICVIIESMRLTLQCLLLNPKGCKLDPLSYVMLVTPLSFVFLGALLCYIVYVQPVAFLGIPTWAHFRDWWPMLLANALLAFALNVAIALFVKHSSAVAAILAGLLKDMAIVCAGVLVLSEAISDLQIFGFALQICGIATWSMVRTFPERFKDGVFQGSYDLIMESVNQVSIANKDAQAKDYGSLEKGGAQ